MSESERERALRALALLSAAVATGEVDAREILAILPEGAQKALSTTSAPPTQLALGVIEKEASALAAPPPSRATTVAGVRAQREQRHRESAQRIFEHWRVVFEHPHARFTSDRQAKVLARLREGYTEARIIAAIDGLGTSDWHRGGNERGQRYDDLLFICRSGAMIEKWESEAPAGAPDERGSIAATQSLAAREEIDAAREEMRAAQKEGDRERYERANARLGALLRGGHR